MKKVIARALVLLAGVVPLWADAQSGVEFRMQVLLDLSKVWYTARLFHPVASANAAAWDAEFIGVLQREPEAMPTEALRAALREWFDAIGDGLRIGERQSDSQWIPASEWTPRVERLEGRRIVVSFGEALLTPPFAPALAKMRALASDLADADEVEFDLRAMRQAAFLVDASNVLNALVARAPAMPEVRIRAYYGWVPESGTTSGGYHVAARAVPMPPVVATGARDVKLVFRANQRTSVPVVALAMAAEGRAVVHADGGPVRPFLQGGGEQVTIGTVPVFIRTAETHFHGAHRERHSFETRAAALRLEEERLPSRAERLFGLLKTYWTFKHFFPYADLADRSWDEGLALALPLAENAKTLEAYVDALQVLTSRSDDGHVGVRGNVTLRAFARSAGVQARLIEGRLAVSDVGDATQLDGAAVEVGDVIESIAGEPVDKLLAEYRKIGAFSTEANFRAKAPVWLLRMPKEGPMQLSLERKDGRRQSVSLPGITGQVRWRSKPREVLDVLERGIGYVDLTRLQPDQVDAMFDRFKDAPALIFDMRGYPRGTGWAVASRLSETLSPVAARFDQPIAVPSPGNASDNRETRTFLQRVPPNARTRYAGRTVMLIDERAVSQSEHTGLFLRAANGTLFLGSPTAGANGDVTNIRVPGGLTISFSGQSVRWPDGRQLQRVGLIPDVHVAPSLAGLQAGRDEVLEAALQYLRSGS